MAALAESRIAELLLPYVGAKVDGVERARAVAPKLSLYLDLLLLWNARTNLTAIRGPEEIVRRHFGESLFAAMHLEGCLPSGAGLLDFGSGAGFPGLPIQLYLPGLKCVLAESQGKKAAFLREAVRTLGVGTEVWPGRVEAMPQERVFGCVTMRAVDGMPDAVSAAMKRVAPDGWLAILAGEDSPVVKTLEASVLTLSAKFPIPESDKRMFYLYVRR